MSRPLNKEEFEALSKDLNEVLEKHGAELSVLSSIQLLKIEENGTNPAKEFEIRPETN